VHKDKFVCFACIDAAIPQKVDMLLGDHFDGQLPHLLGDIVAALEVEPIEILLHFQPATRFSPAIPVRYERLQRLVAVPQAARVTIDQDALPVIYVICVKTCL